MVVLFKHISIIIIIQYVRSRLQLMDLDYILAVHSKSWLRLKYNVFKKFSIRKYFILY